MTDDGPTPPWKVHVLPFFRVFYTLVIFVAGAFAGPFIGKFAEKWADDLLPSTKSAQILVCAPLREARTIIREKQPFGDAIIADQSSQIMNETSVVVKNTSKAAFKNANLNVYPLAGSGGPPDILYTQMVANSLQGSKSYNVFRDKAAFRIQLPIMNPNDFVIIATNFAVPVGFVIELFGEGLSEKKEVEPGCKNDQSLEFNAAAHAMRVFFQYYSKRCQKPDTPTGTVNCKIEDDVPFSITEEMRGKKLTVEQRIVKD